MGWRTVPLTPLWPGPVAGTCGQDPWLGSVAGTCGRDLWPTRSGSVTGLAAVATPPHVRGQRSTVLDRAADAQILEVEAQSDLRVVQAPLPNCEVFELRLVVPCSRGNLGARLCSCTWPVLTARACLSAVLLGRFSSFPPLALALAFAVAPPSLLLLLYGSRASTVGRVHTLGSFS